MTDHDGCEHPFDAHVMWASNTGEPLDGGHMTCPEVGCVCYSTWSTQGRPRPDHLAKGYRTNDTMDDLVAGWHGLGVAPSTPALHEFLGLSREEYWEWVKNPDAKELW